MSSTTDSAKSRTVALPNISKGLLQARHIQAKIQARASAGESGWNGMVFGPYLVPLSRRAE